MPMLVVAVDGKATRIPLRNETVTVGRGPENDICIDDPNASRRHCQIEPLGAGLYRVVDLESTNGTYLNGDRVTSMVLEPDDFITIGQVTVLYAVGSEVPARFTEFGAALFPWKPAQDHTGPRSPRRKTRSSDSVKVNPGRASAVTLREADPFASARTQDLDFREWLPRITRIEQEVRTDRDLGSLLSTILAEMLERTRFERAVLLLFDEDKRVLQAVLDCNVEYKNLPLDEQRHIRAVTQESIQRRQTVLRASSSLDMDRAVSEFVPPAVGSFLSVPLTVAEPSVQPERRRMVPRRQALGAIYLDSGEEIDALDDQEQLVIDTMAAETCSALRKAQLQYQATTDPMTRLLNRDVILRVITDEIEYVRESSSEFGLALLDLDRFKRINDTFGHGVGDEVLKRVARRIQRSIRRNDYIGRWGGEEFIIVLPGASVSTVMNVTRKVSEAITSTPIGESRLRVTASMGVVACPEHGTSPETLIRRADQALYAAKGEGRNRIHVFGPVLERAPRAHVEFEAHSPGHG